MNGKPIIQDTRITVKLIVKILSERISVTDLVKFYFVDLGCAYDQKKVSIILLRYHYLDLDRIATILI
ncbi:hypothetical protein RCH18_002789 [Flavobacterium sp. PL11]|nr:hypothetical protein [Flavobacterium sp. PL11]